MHKSFKLFLISITTFSFVIFLWGIINFLFLQKLPISYNYFEKNENFYNIRLDKIFISHSKPKQNKQIIKPKIKIETLQGVKLKAIFENGDNSFIIIEDKKDIFLNLNQKYKGYKLIKVTKNSAIFEKNNKQYEIKFSQTKLNIPTSTSSTKKPIEVPTEISKTTIKQYISNPSKIWKNISIIHNTKGYKIIYVKKGSIFDKLGLKKGDYIIEVNNKKLNTDSDAWQIYKNINKFDEINIKIKRNNQIKELNYEIY